MYNKDAIPDYKDDAEFEARVAKKLSIERGYVNEYGRCTIGTHCPNILCEECRLKYARIQVEEEMDEKL